MSGWSGGRSGSAAAAPRSPATRRLPRPERPTFAARAAGAPEPMTTTEQTPPAPPEDRAEPRLIEREMRESYLTYALSVIHSRALPDVRDGLKPSQRRILVAMNDLNLSPRAKYRKCAKIAGDTSGNYHPRSEERRVGKECRSRWSPDH